MCAQGVVEHSTEPAVQEDEREKSGSLGGTLCGPCGVGGMAGKKKGKKKGKKGDGAATPTPKADSPAVCGRSNARLP